MAAQEPRPEDPFHDVMAAVKTGVIFKPSAVSYVIAQVIARFNNAHAGADDADAKQVGFSRATPASKRAQPFESGGGRAFLLHPTSHLQFASWLLWAHEKPLPGYKLSSELAYFLLYQAHEEKNMARIYQLANYIIEAEKGPFSEDAVLIVLYSWTDQPRTAAWAALLRNALLLMEDNTAVLLLAQDTIKFDVLPSDACVIPTATPLLYPSPPPSPPCP